MCLIIKQQIKNNEMERFYLKINLKIEKNKSNYFKLKIIELETRVAALRLR